LKKKIFVGLMYLLLTVTIIGVSAYVYEQATQTVTQTIKEVATINLQSSVLGSINEGEAKSYTKSDVASLGNAISLTTTATNVYLHLNSDLETQVGSYSVYSITVKFVTVPGGSSHSIDDTACTMTIASPDPASVTLDVAGSWAFDLEVSTTAKSVTLDTPTTVTVVVSAESS
jgi:hypothetical protein